MGEKTKEKRGGLRRIFAAGLTLILIALAVLAFLFRDSLGGDGVRRALGREGEDVLAAGEPFSFEMGSSQVFALAGEGLAIASATGLQLLDAEGYTVAKQVFSLETPAVATSPVLSAFYDVGGTALHVARPNGVCESLPTEGAIISVTVSESGYLAVSTELTGYKGLVRVYNSELTLLYEWYSRTGYLLLARVTPDGRGMVASSVTTAGSVLHFFSLEREEEQARYVAQDELLLEFDFLSDGRMAAVSGERLLLLDSAGAVTGTYDFGDMYLTDYRISGDFAALFLCRYRSGNAGMLVCVGSGGDVLGTLELQRDLLGLSTAGRRLLALYSDGLVLYTQELEELMTYADTLAVKAALLRTRGGALLISGYGADLLAVP